MNNIKKEQRLARKASPNYNREHFLPNGTKVVLDTSNSRFSWIFQDYWELTWDQHPTGDFGLYYGTHICPIIQLPVPEGHYSWEQLMPDGIEVNVWKMPRWMRKLFLPWQLKEFRKLLHKYPYVSVTFVTEYTYSWGTAERGIVYPQLIAIAVDIVVYCNEIAIVLNAVQCDHVSYGKHFDTGVFTIQKTEFGSRPIVRTLGPEEKEEIREDCRYVL